MDFTPEFWLIIGATILLGYLSFHVKRAITIKINHLERLLFFQHKDSDIYKKQKLKAAERLLLFLERNQPSVLSERIKPKSDVPHLYVGTLMKNIETELEHNLTQQLYISSNTWQAVVKAKNEYIEKISLEFQNNKAHIKTAQQLPPLFYKIDLLGDSRYRKAKALLINEIR